MNQKKILFITNISGNGIGAFSKSSIYASQNLGLKFYIAANYRKANKNQIENDQKKFNIVINNIDFFRNPLHPKNYIAYKQLVKLMKKEKFDIVHCNTPVGGVYGRLAARKCNINKVIYEAHGFHFYKGAPIKNWLLYYPIEIILAKITDSLITINKEDYKIAKKFKLRKNGKVFYVPGVGIDTGVYENNDINKNILRKEMGFNENDILLISVGRLDSNKNNKVLIRAVNLLKDKNVHLLICGDGIERENLKCLALELNIQNQIHFLGNRSDMNDLYQIADIFVMASFREGLSRSIMEAMSCGLPCIVSDIRGNRDLIIEDSGGYLVNPRCPGEFSAKIKVLKDKCIRKKMKIYNINYIRKFHIDVIIRELMKIYSNV